MTQGATPDTSSGRADDPDAETSAARVLEIGEFALFHRNLPEQTHSYFAGYRSYHGEGRRFFGLRDLLGTMRRVSNRDHYDLVVLHPPMLAWWNLRAIAYAFRYSVLEGRPRELYGALTSPLYFQLLRRIRFGTPVIAIDREDHFCIPAQHVGLIDKVDAFYKRELPVDRWQAFMEADGGRLPGKRMRESDLWRRRLAKLRPIGLGVRRAHVVQTAGLAGAPKRHDIFFAGMVDGSSHVRERAADLLERFRQAGLSVDYPRERLPYGEFLKRCSEAWITLSPEGFGWDCYRHVEAALVGSVPLMNAPTIERSYPFRHGEHCLFYFPDDPDGTVELVVAALADKTKLAQMARQAETHARLHLTEPAICRALISEWVEPLS